MEISKMDSFWDEQIVSQAHGHRHASGAAQQPVGGGTGSHNPYERNLNFATVAVDDGEYGFPKKKTVRDPLSHRIIEKRRRDRMNNCLADLARLLPPSSLRKGRGRIEKTEIVELAIKHLRHLRCHPCPSGDKCEYSGKDNPGGANNSSISASCSSSSTSSGYQSSHEEQFRMGFQECLSEAMHFLVEQEGLYAGDAMCEQLVKHLNNHCDTVLRDHWQGNQGKVVPGFRRSTEATTDFKKTTCSGGSTSSGYHPNGSSPGSDGNGGNDGEGTDPFALPVQNPSQHLTVDTSGHSLSIIDYEAESNPSTPLSVENSDVLSIEGKNNGRSSSKPPIPSIICSHSFSNNGGSPVPVSNGRSSDDGDGSAISIASAYRYKFKSNIKQRFTADCQTKPEDGLCYPHESVEKADGDRDMEGGSDIEERDDGISITEDGVMPLQLLQSVSDDSDVKPISLADISTRNSAGGLTKGGTTATHVTGQQISANTPSSDLEKSTLESVPSNSNHTVGRIPVVIPEIKLNSDEVLPVVLDIKGPLGSKTQLPLIVSGVSSFPDGQGVPAFALHEKGLYYVPLTIDKSIISPYINKVDPCNSPPLYPVTISVCFVLNPDKKVKQEVIENLEVALPKALTSKVVELCQANNSIPVALPLTSGSSPVTNSSKSLRRAYRDSNNFLMNRFALQNRMSKESRQRTHESRGTTGNNNYQILPLISPSVSSTYDVLRGTSNSSTRHSGNGFHSYQDTNTLGNPAPHLNDVSRRDTERYSITGRSATGGSSSSGGSSYIDLSESNGRKRSICSSPSISGSGGSMGYHSWNDKGSSSSQSHEYYNIHPNTQNSLQSNAHGQGVVSSASSAAMGSLNRRPDPNLAGFHVDNLRGKDIYSHNYHDKRSKKSRNADQESKQS